MLKHEAYLELLPSRAEKNATSLDVFIIYIHDNILTKSEM